MHLLAHCRLHRSADKDPEATRRQEDALRATGWPLGGRSGRIGNIAYLEDDGSILTRGRHWLLAAGTRRFFAEIAHDPLLHFVYFFPQSVQLFYRTATLLVRHLAGSSAATDPNGMPRAAL